MSKINSFFEGGFSKAQKIVIAIIFIIIVCLLAYLLYALFFKFTPKAPPISLPTTHTGPGLPSAQPGTAQYATSTTPGDLATALESIKPVNPQQIKTTPSKVANGGITKDFEVYGGISISPTLGANGNDLQFYNPKDSKFYSIDENGQTKTLSDKLFHNVQNVYWSSNKTKAIIEYPDGANIIYDFDSKKQTTLPKHWEDFHFSPDGKQIISKSIGLDPDNRWLSKANEDGSNPEAILALGNNSDSVYPLWSPNNQVVALYTEGMDFNRQRVFFVGLNQENFNSMVIEGRGFQPEWSPSGDYLLYSVYSADTNSKPNLWSVNALGHNIGTGRRSLDTETWADKCIFANNQEIYCAVPQELKDGSGLFPELAKQTEDSLYKINIVNGQKKLIAIPENPHNISNLILSADNKYLYFTDSTDNKIYKINL